MKNLSLLLFISGLFLSSSLLAQNVFPGKQTIDKKEYFGLNLNSSISDRFLGNYWEDYLKKTGKTNSRRGVYTVDRATIPGITTSTAEVISQVSTSKNITQLFMALKIGDRFVANFTDSTYRAAEQFLKDFSGYAALRDDVRKAEEFYSLADKNHQRLQKDNERLTKEIERTQKRLEELAKEQETNKNDLAGSVIDMQAKQKDLEAAKAKVPKL
ncbi:hypothetical protein [Arundinibacter roseus]|uniref:Uncharacterized protein n=1 Tax=Arundinibacter roseus TaxID=2070510 RepID=A0A4R4KIF5_9BACT|nr:hypothetical protein [Arundinibacter roseus]TDB67957.1 hypothetical protein EZE20_03245 [Arundinibacter roseus]